VLSSGGKRLRPALLLIVAELCGYTGPRRVQIAAAIELLHTATLLHDDVVDFSELRRGRPSANALWGNRFSGGRSFPPELRDSYAAPLDELFASIRRGKPINNGHRMTTSTLMGIMGRMAAYTGQEVTWEQALKSQLDLSPSGYTWDDTPPPAEIAVPGVTPLV